MLAWHILDLGARQPSWIGIYDPIIDHSVPAGVWRDPHLDEAEWVGLVQVVLAMPHARARGHELDRTPPEALGCSHAVLVR